MSDLQKISRAPLPPQNLEAEKAVLGALLLDVEAFDRIAFLEPECFYSLQHQIIFATIRELINENNTPDILVLTEKLREKNLLEKAGGRAYIATLPSLVPTTENIEFYANIVLDASVKRSLVHIASEIHASCFEPSVGGNELLEEAQQKLFAITEAGQRATYSTPRELIEKVLNKISEREQNPGQLLGLPSGFPSLDDLTSGFQDSDLIIIGARPGIGKTALALSIFSHIAVHEGRPAAFFSLEMGKEQIMQRLFALEANISMNSMRNGRLSDAELVRLSDAAGNIYEKPAFIVDMPNMKMLDLKALTRQLIRAEKVEIIFIDYIGLITSDNPHLQPFDQMAEISRSLKSLARELQIPIIALSQLGREAEGKRPSLANIRGSGAIEQDADIVIFLNRERNVSESERTENDGIETDLILSKHRNGPTGTIKLVFKDKFAKYAEKSYQN
ncbi:MAG: replicative DNA helicase [Treponemataceae bacterium]